MPRKTYIIRGRHIDESELEYIRYVVAEHWDKGRSAISRILCELWDWRQANGLLKERACRVLLLALEKKGEIKLPPRMKGSFRHPKRADRREYPHDTSPLFGTVSEFRSLTIKYVGLTKGRGKYDQYTNSKPVKAVYLYPLRKNYRELLNG